MYILKSGKVSVYKRELGVSSRNKYIRTLEPPSFFEEYALVSNSPRTASVVATGILFVLHFAQGSFRMFIFCKCNYEVQAFSRGQSNFEKHQLLPITTTCDISPTKRVSTSYIH